MFVLESNKHGNIRDVKQLLLRKHLHQLMGLMISWSSFTLAFVAVALVPSSFEQTEAELWLCVMDTIDVALLTFSPT